MSEFAQLAWAFASVVGGICVVALGVLAAVWLTLSVAYQCCNSYARKVQIISAFGEFMRERRRR